MSSLTATIDGSIVVTVPFTDSGPFLGVVNASSGVPSLTAKISPEGQLLWLRTIATDVPTGEKTTIWGSTSDADGNIYVAGDTGDFAAFTGTIQTDGPVHGGFIIKYTAGGDAVWERRWIEWPLHDVAVNPEGSVYVGGSVSPDGQDREGLLLKLEKDGSLAWSKEYSDLIRVALISCSATGNIFAGANDLVPGSVLTIEFAPDGSRISTFGSSADLAGAADSVGETLVNHYRLTPEMQTIAQPPGVRAAAGPNGTLFVATQIFPESGVTLTKYSPVSDSISYSFTGSDLVLHWDPELGEILEASPSGKQDWFPLGGGVELNGELVFTNSTDTSALQFFRVRK